MHSYNKSFKAKCWPWMKHQLKLDEVNMFSIKKKFNSLNNYPWMYYRKLLRRIKNYLTYPIINFGKDSIHVLLLEDMSIDANKELNKIFSFLNAKPFMMQQADLPKYKVNTILEKNKVLHRPVEPTLSSKSKMSIIKNCF